MGLWDLKTLKRIYLHEINRNDRGIWAKLKESCEQEYDRKVSEFFEEKLKNNWAHLCCLSEYMARERATRLSIILDNADQLDENTQKEVFLFAQSLFRSSKALIVLSLREGYYYKMRLHPPFDAFHSNVYHITAPSYGEVLAKRIAYAMRKVSTNGNSRGQGYGGFSCTIDNDKVKNFLASLKTALFGSTNSDMLKFLEETTYPNIREGLDVFNQFLVSGYTEVDNYILRQVTSPDSQFPIPIWEFIKAVALNNKKYYNEERSRIFNLFNPVSDCHFHFVKIKLLSFLSTRLCQEDRSERFSLYTEIVGSFTSMGYSAKIVAKEIEQLLQAKLIETKDQVSDTIINTDSLQMSSLGLSRKGNYYFSTLLNTFSYLELMLQTTPIFDEVAFSEVFNVFPYVDDNGKRDLNIRVMAVEKILAYLQSEEQKEALATNSEKLWITNRIKNNGLLSDIERIKSKIATYRRYK